MQIRKLYAKQIKGTDKIFGGFKTAMTHDSDENALRKKLQRKERDI